MTPLNLAKHRNSPHMAFWRMIKEGNDHFEVTRREPKVDVCEKRYVFDAAGPNGSATPNFSPRAQCPPYEVPAQIATLVKQKRDKDEREFAALSAKGTATVAVRTGSDGGMHPVFLSKLRPQPTGNDPEGRFASMVSTPAPGTIPAHAVPPKLPEETTGAVAFAATSPAPASPAAFGLASAESRPAAAPQTAGPNAGALVRVATAGEPAPGSLAGTAAAQEGTFDKMGRWFGLGGSAPTPTDAKPAATAKPAVTAKPAAKPAVAAKPAAVAAKPTAVAAKPAAKSPAAQSAQGKPASDAGALSKPAQTADAKPATSAGSNASAPNAAPTGMIVGAQPVVQTGAFDGRWGSFR
jgi:hypothetical protein